MLELYSESIGKFVVESIINMGNICSANQSSSLGSQSSRVLDSAKFELFYSPAMGEGETLKVIFSYMTITIREHISHSQDNQMVTLAANKRVVRGAFECLKYICKAFKLYPCSVYNAQISEKLCSEIFETWRFIRDAFYRNDRVRIHQFYLNQLVALLEKIEVLVIENSYGIFENKISMIDFLVLTLTYNLFFNKKQEQYKKLLDDYAPKLSKHCYFLLSTHPTIANYFHTRTFNLYT